MSSSNSATGESLTGGAGPPPQEPGAGSDGRLGDLQEKSVQLFALVVVEHAERAGVLYLGHLHHARDRETAPAREMDRLHAAVRVVAAALGEAEPLEVVDEADHRALVDPQAPAERALRHRPLGVDHRKHLGMLAADLLITQRTLEPLGGMLRDERGQIS